MAYYSSKLFLSALLACYLSLFTVMSRPLINPKTTLLARLKLDKEGSSSCWDSLFELQSCTGEVVLFFLNGETYLGPSCCRAIKTIENQCWPSMLGSIGINSEEGDILLGYCDASESSSTPPLQPSSLEDVIPITTTTSHVVTTP